MPVKTNRTLVGFLLFWTLWATIPFLTSCVAPPRTNTRNRKPDPPGLYSLTGWQNANYGVDINGEVGHPLYVGAPSARCEPSRHWTLNATTESGALPDGVTLNDSNFQISGIPTKRGHWIVKMKLYNVECGGSYYQGFTQELRFHITGTGSVIQ